MFFVRLPPNPPLAILFFTPMIRLLLFRTLIHQLSGITWLFLWRTFLLLNIFRGKLTTILGVGKTLLNRDAPQSQQYRYFSCLQLTRAMLIIFVCRVSCEIRLLTHDVGFNCICCP
ncbi:hypothetical protein GLYMA_12G151533v4 [Glycine max]|nr:hypothetical protein GLYMA_12G151533v4 [Glycine max]KAH1143294.1 hypothetical protein GYH30_033821 [Glycine max]